MLHFNVKDFLVVRLIFSISALGFFLGGYAQKSLGHAVPPNDIHLEDTYIQTLGSSNVTEKQFNEIIDKAYTFYKSIVSRKHWGDLTIRRSWSSSLVSVSAQRKGDDWIVNMYGGLARRPEITPDGFTLVLCHELGHHLAGFPFVSKWESNEGQSDYFAAQVCVKKFWEKETEINSQFFERANELPSELVDNCRKSYKEENWRNICFRTAFAGMSLARLLTYIDRSPLDPSFEFPDLSTVDRTYNGHPDAQCRLDTYVAAATCSTSFDDNVIPGLYGSWKKAQKEAFFN